MCCRFLQTLTFLVVHGFYGSSEAALSALRYLNEDYIISIGHDQVDFTEADIVIAFQQPEALLFRPTRARQFLTSGVQSLGYDFRSSRGGVGRVASRR